MLLIEELKAFNKNNLGTWNIMNSKHSKLWNILFFSSIGLNSILFIIPVITLTYYWWFVWYILYIPCALFTYYLINFMQLQNTSILQNTYNHKFNLDIQNNWDYKTIYHIEYLILLTYFKTNQINLRKDDIRLIIESLKFESAQSTYNYKSWGIILTFLSVLSGAFLGSLFNLGKNIPDLYSLLKIIFTISFYIFTAIVYVEIFVVKRIIEFRKNKYQRLIRVLENYCINLSS